MWRVVNELRVLKKPVAIPHSIIERVLNCIKIRRSEYDELFLETMGPATDRPID
jgi:hypothetical protein